jgi:phosphatidylglycerophosphate synthase
MSSNAATPAGEERRGAHGQPTRARRPAVVPVAAAVLLTPIAALALSRPFALETAYVAGVTAAALLGGVLVAMSAAKHLPGATFGVANTVTLVRGALTVLLAGLVVAATGTAVAWLGVVLAIVAVSLDGVDGRLARGRGESSGFGARFDMETDAFLILVLAALVWQAGKAGPWILSAGLLRYAFVGASRALPWLADPLPASRRRQAVCVVQIVSLITALAPIIPPPAAAFVALLGLAALVASFGVDVARLARRATV